MSKVEGGWVGLGGVGGLLGLGWRAVRMILWSEFSE